MNIVLEEMEEGIVDKIDCTINVLFDSKVKL